MKMTPKRKMVYDVLHQSSLPLSAEQIHLKLQNQAIDLSTIYRALDLFLGHQITAKQYINQTFFYYLKEKGHHHYMMCDTCKSLFEIDCHLDEMIKTIEQETHFLIKDHDVMFVGICKSCQTIE